MEQLRNQRKPPPGNLAEGVTMASIQYMTASGDWAISCQDGTPPPSPALILAPADAAGLHGMEGMRWTGSAWVDDPGAEARAFAVMYPAQALAQEREGMVCTRLQAMLALGEARWGAVTAALAAQPWDVRARFNDATEWRRLNPLVIMLGGQVLGLTEAQLDDLFRLAVTL